MERGTAVAEFDRARDGFLDALRPAPDEALTYLREGDIYAIGGLAVHCNWVLRHYSRVLVALASGGGAELHLTDPLGEQEEANRRALAGLTAGERAPELAELETLHDEVRHAALAAAPDSWERKTPVVYGAAAEAYPTSPDDVVGWLRDHYQEHVPHATELLAEWQSSRDR